MREYMIKVNIISLHNNDYVVISCKIGELEIAIKSIIAGFKSEDSSIILYAQDIADLMQIEFVKGSCDHINQRLRSTIIRSIEEVIGAYLGGKIKTVEVRGELYEDN